MNAPILLTYHLSGEHGGKLRFAAMRCGVRLRPVEIGEYRKPLGTLCGGASSEGENYTGEDFAEPMMVMAFFSPTLVNRFLQTMKQLRAEPVQLKAVLTAANSDWDSLMLHEELTKEAEAMAAHRAPAHRE